MHPAILATAAVIAVLAFCALLIGWLMLTDKIGDAMDFNLPGRLVVGLSPILLGAWAFFYMVASKAAP